jgi:hypothetical protein
MPAEDSDADSSPPAAEEDASLEPAADLSLAFDDF